MGRDVGGVKCREWVDRLRRFSSLNVSVADFCDAEGVSVSSYYVWRRKLACGRVGEEAAASASDSARQRTFLPVRIVAQLPAVDAAATAARGVSGSTSAARFPARSACESSPASSSAAPSAGSPAGSLAVLPVDSSVVPGSRMEIVLTNGVRVLVPTSDVAAIQQAIFAAGQISATGEAASC